MGKMEWARMNPWLLTLGAMALVQVTITGSSGCFPQEKAALLDLKGEFVLPPSWVDDPKSNCCDWERVTCDSFSAHVLHLSLSSCELESRSSTLNLSLFQSFHQLRILNLSHNNIFHFIWDPDNRSKSAMKRLETLDLGFNALNETIMEPLTALTSLRNLILADNSIRGPFPTKELSLLPNLELLDLSNNFLSGPLTAEALGNLSNKLEVLRLRYAYNRSLGPAKFQGLCKMKQLQLQELDLRGNNLIGTLDACLGNLTSLRALHVSGNNLSGSIPALALAGLASIEYLSLSKNNFEGLFSLNIMANNSKLKGLRIGEMNTKKFQVETENPPWIPSFQLEYLQISHCQLNLPTRIIPTFLSHQHGLRSIDLSYNKLVGMFPNWLLANNQKLQGVTLEHNSFNGTFQLPFHDMDYLQILDLSNNQIQGELPNNIGALLPRLGFLDVASNKFNGHIPTSVGDMSNLWTLNLAHNNFSGQVSKHILLGCVSLNTLILSNNSLQGQIFSTPTIGGADLQALMIDNNQFNGTLSIANISSPLVFGISRNNFEGEIGKEMCNFVGRLWFLDLSHNRFSGGIPDCLSLPFAASVHLAGNDLNGTIPEGLVNSPMLVNIDLRNNKFTGTLPNNIYGHQYLRYVLLGGNQLQGQVSSLICQLKHIDILDLSRNNLTASLPSCFNDLSFGEATTNFTFDIDNPFDPFATSLDFDDGYYYELTTDSGIFVNSFTRYGQVNVEFITKNLLMSYTGGILYYMSGLDLSSNQFTGEIPHQLGDLHALRSLNLSHNHFNGTIPESFHKLQNIESLDLSYNNLSGSIPPQLQDLYSLSTFDVSYNNLSGTTPHGGQFGTFDESSYKGNPHLNWNNSNRGIASPPPPLSPSSLNSRDKNDSFVDFTSFYSSFAASYAMVLLMFVTILWINPHWHRAWFYFIEGCLLKCFGQFLERAFC